MSSPYNGMWSTGGIPLTAQAAKPPGDPTSPTSNAPDHLNKGPNMARTIHGWKWALAMTAILSTTFLFALDNTIVADIQPAIVNQFNDVVRLPWFGVGFGLGSTAVLPWGKAYGIFSVKWLFIATVILFEVGSTICGAAPNVNALIIGRVIAGIGGSGMYSGCLTYISVTTTNIERPMYMAGVAVAWGAGTVVGPIIGGAFADSAATWRWVSLRQAYAQREAYFSIYADISRRFTSTWSSVPFLPLLTYSSSQTSRTCQIILFCQNSSW